MNTNIITFPKIAKTRPAPQSQVAPDNVIRLQDVKTRTKCRRTHFGVFYSTDAVRFAANTPLAA